MLTEHKYVMMILILQFVENSVSTYNITLYVSNIVGVATTPTHPPAINLAAEDP